MVCLKQAPSDVFVTAFKIGWRRKGLWEIIHFIGSSAPELIAAIFIAQESRDEVDKGMSLFRAMNNSCHKSTRTFKFEGLIFASFCVHEVRLSLYPCVWLMFYDFPITVIICSAFCNAKCTMSLCRVAWTIYRVGIQATCVQWWEVYPCNNPSCPMTNVEGRIKHTTDYRGSFDKQLWRLISHLPRQELCVKPILVELEKMVLERHPEQHPPKTSQTLLESGSFFAKVTFPQAVGSWWVLGFVS